MFFTYLYALETDLSKSPDAVIGECLLFWYWQPVGARFEYDSKHSFWTTRTTFHENSCNLQQRSPHKIVYDMMKLSSKHILLQVSCYCFLIFSTTPESWITYRYSFKREFREVSDSAILIFLFSTTLDWCVTYIMKSCKDIIFIENSHPKQSFRVRFFCKFYHSHNPFFCFFTALHR